MNRAQLISTLADALDLHEDDVKIALAKENGDVVLKLSALVLDDATEDGNEEDSESEDDEDDEDAVPEAEFDDTNLDEDA